MTRDDAIIAALRALADAVETIADEMDCGASARSDVTYARRIITDLERGLGLP